MTYILTLFSSFSNVLLWFTVMWIYPRLFKSINPANLSVCIYYLFERILYKSSYDSLFLKKVSSKKSHLYLKIFSQYSTFFKPIDNIAFYFTKQRLFDLKRKTKTVKFLKNIYCFWKKKQKSCNLKYHLLLLFYLLLIVNIVWFIMMNFNQ